MVRRLKNAAGRNLVGFEVGGILYAVDLKRVREIVRPAPTLALPHLPEVVTGVVDHRGDVVPVVDLRKYFGVTPSAEERRVRWIIVTRGERLFGLCVDRVNDVFGVLEADARELPALSDHPAARAIRAAYGQAGRLLFVVDVDLLTEVANRVALPEAAELPRGVDGAG
jgi:purine-binding chemotaxis protein CheW